MIKSFRHAGLERFFKTGSKAGIQPHHASRLEDRLGILNEAEKPSDMDIDGWHFHPLKGDLKGQYAVNVDRIWRLTFAWDNGDAIVVDYQDYHEG
jgi:proteic killer suppression protein